jgi:hypothetical protein
MGMERLKNTKTESDPRLPETSEAKKEREMKSLQERSLPLTALNLKMPNINTSIDKAINAAPNTWDENGKVIIWVDNNGRKYATPSSLETKKLMWDYFKEASVTVPPLDNPDVWGESKGGKDHVEWQRLESLSSSLERMKQPVEDENAGVE